MKKIPVLFSVFLAMSLVGCGGVKKHPAPAIVIPTPTATPAPTEPKPPTSVKASRAILNVVATFLSPEQMKLQADFRVVSDKATNELLDAAALRDGTPADPTTVMLELTVGTAKPVELTLTQDPKTKVFNSKDESVAKPDISKAFFIAMAPGNVKSNFMLSDSQTIAFPSMRLLLKEEPQKDQVPVAGDMVEELTLSPTKGAKIHKYVAAEKSSALFKDGPTTCALRASGIKVKKLEIQCKMNDDVEVLSDVLKGIDPSTKADRAEFACTFRPANVKNNTIPFEVTVNTVTPIAKGFKIGEPAEPTK